jgi:competence protein ComEC
VLTSIDPAHPMLRGARETRRCAAGSASAVGPLRIDVVRPLAVRLRAAPRLSSNAASCVLRVALGPHRLLLTGDLPAREEAELVAGGGLAADWISVPHHGSRSSSSEALLDAVRPAWASVQAGYRNRFGHPDARSSPVTWHAACMWCVVMNPEWHSGDFAATGTVELHRWRASMHRYWHNRPGSWCVRLRMPRPTASRIAPDPIGRRWQAGACPF